MKIVDFILEEVQPELYANYDGLRRYVAGPYLVDRLNHIFKHGEFDNGTTTWCVRFAMEERHEDYGCWAAGFRANLIHRQTDDHLEVVFNQDGTGNLIDEIADQLASFLRGRLSYASA